MCYYKKGDLKKGNNHQLRRVRDNPKDNNCFEVRSRHITMATMNMNFSRLLVPFVDEKIIWELKMGNENRIKDSYIDYIEIQAKPYNASECKKDALDC